jgi:hypothetical protein
MGCNGLTTTFCYGLVETLHIWSLEWWLEGTHLVYYTTKGPDIGFTIIWLVFPDLGAGVVGGSGLGIEETVFGNFRDIHITKFDKAIFG